MKHNTYTVITRPALYGGLERPTIIVIGFLSLVVMWFTSALILIVAYLVQHIIAFLFTRKDPDFMTITLVRALNFNKKRYEP